MLETLYFIQGLIPSLDNGNPKPRSRCAQDVCLVSETQGLGVPLSKVGFPIRKSTDQSFFAAPHGLSQRSTSFIASQRQGIHRMPLRHLIALIINARRARRAAGHPGSMTQTDGKALILRKTSLLRDRSDGPAVKRGRQTSATHARTRRRGHTTDAGVRVPARDLRPARKLGAISSSRCQTTRGAARWPATRKRFPSGRA